MNLKMLAQCQKLEFIRINMVSGTEWGIVGDQTQFEFPVLILTGESAGHVLHAFGTDMNVKSEFENKPVLSYGDKYSLDATYSSPSDVSDGPNFQKKGALIFTNDGNFLRCIDRDKPRFFDLKTGLLRSEPIAHKAAFGEWGIWLEDEDRARIIFEAKQ